MKVSIKDVKSEKWYATLKQIGFDGLDLRFPTWDRREEIVSDEFEARMEERYQTIREAGLAVSQVHLTYYPGHLPPIGDGGYGDFAAYMLPIFIKEIEVTAKMDCRNAVIHLYFDADREISREGNLQLIASLLPTLEANDVVLSIENIYGPKAGEAYLSTADELLYYIDHFKSPYLGVCLDTGHAITRGQDPVKMLEKLGSAVTALHLHANVQGRDMHLPPMLLANVDWQKFYETLTRVGYGGTFNMEITPPKQMTREAALSYYRMALSVARGLIRGDATSWMEE